MITRHILTLPVLGHETGRKVHYRKCGKGPALVLVHQSPRSSAEYEPLMEKWGEHFTCIAPDTPGFGQSDPLPGEPEIEDFADAQIEFLTALGVKRCAAYGFHSGAAILLPALNRNPELFSCQVLGGYPVWTDAEIALLGSGYFPPFQPQPFGEHLTWVWNRFLEQSWIFPWFDYANGVRLPQAHADPARIHPQVMDMLDAGDAYRIGYGAAMRAKSAVPPADAQTPPVLLSSYDNDPLQAHMDRLNAVPEGWERRKVTTPDDLTAAALGFLKTHADTAPCPDLSEDTNEGWVALDEGLIHWHGERDGTMVLHAPAAELSDPGPGQIAVDVPGHGLSSDFADPVAAIEQAAEKLGTQDIVWPEPPKGDPARLYPDLTPDRFGSHLLKAWSAARAEAFFAPWYCADNDHAVPLDQAGIQPEAIALRTRARLRAGDAARRLHEVLEAKAR